MVERLWSTSVLARPIAVCNMYVPEGLPIPQHDRWAQLCDEHLSHLPLVFCLRTCTIFKLDTIILHNSFVVHKPDLHDLDSSWKLSLDKHFQYLDIVHFQGCCTTCSYMWSAQTVRNRNTMYTAVSVILEYLGGVGGTQGGHLWVVHG